MPYSQDVPKDAFKFFEWMCEEGVQPDDITFVCLLSACSHAGLKDEGMRCYAPMITVYMISEKYHSLLLLVVWYGPNSLKVPLS
jgi:hypothetical protein